MSKNLTPKLTDARFLGDPSASLDALRNAGPLVRFKVPLVGTVWATTTDAGARALLKDASRFARNPANAGGKDASRLYWWMPPFMRPLMRNILLSDGQDHARLRGAVDAAFARTSVEELRGEITAIARDLLAEIDPGRPVDIMPAYARALPLQVICALLGIRPELRAKLTHAIAPIAGPTNTRTILRALPGLWRALRLLRAEIADVRKSPRAGLISELIHTAPGAPRLSDDELLSMLFTLFIAGHETTVHLIGDTLLTVTENPELRATFTGDDVKAQALAIEEALRFHSPVMMTKPLFVRADTEFLGQPLKQGDRVLALLIGANRDPARFDCPHRFTADRRPNAHLAFGFGPHVCLGLGLARAEAQIALAELLRQFPDMQRADQGPPVFTRRFGLRGLKSLNLKLTAA